VTQWAVCHEKLPTGTQRALTREASRLHGTYGATSVTFYVIGFDNAENTNSYYNEKVSFVKDNIGYTEIKTGLNNCFAFKEYDLFQDKVGVACRTAHTFLSGQ